MKKSSTPFFSSASSSLAIFFSSSFHTPSDVHLSDLKETGRYPTAGTSTHMSTEVRHKHTQICARKHTRNHLDSFTKITRSFIHSIEQIQTCSHQHTCTGPICQLLPCDAYIYLSRAHLFCLCKITFITMIKS